MHNYTRTDGPWNTAFYTWLCDYWTKNVYKDSRWSLYQSLRSSSKFRQYDVFLRRWVIICRVFWFWSSFEEFYNITLHKTTHKSLNFTILTGEIFRLGDEAMDSPMLLTCSYFHDLKSAKWAWTDPFTQQQHRTLPQCEAMCKSNPPLDASVRTNWTTVFSI